MSSAEAAVPTPIKRRRAVRLPVIKLTGNARALSEAPRRKRLSGAGQRVPGRFRQGRLKEAAGVAATEPQAMGFEYPARFGVQGGRLIPDSCPAAFVKSSGYQS